MIEYCDEFNFDGFRYELRRDCFGEQAFYIMPSGERQELPIHGPYMTGMEAIMIHAMNSRGYSP